jgi:hypothetical protein
MSSDSEQPIAPTQHAAETEIGGEVELTLLDIEAGLASLPRAKIARAIALVGASLVIAMIGYRWYEGKDRVVLLIVGVALLALLAFNLNPARKIAKKVYESLPADAKKIAIGINNEGLVLRSGGAESEVPWSAMWKLVETREVLVVFVSRENAQIIPKRAFSKAQLTRLRELAAQNILGHDEPWLTPELRKRMMLWLLSFVVVWAVWFFFGRK